MPIRRIALVLALAACGAPPAEPASEIDPPVTTPATTPASAIDPPATTAPPARAIDPAIAAATPPATRCATIAASGDLVLNPRVLESVLASDEGYAPLFAAWAARLEEGDVTYVNLEVPLVSDQAPLDSGWPRGDPRRPRRSPTLGATPALADALFGARVRVVSIANNHAFDQGHAGLVSTLAALERAGVAAAGAGGGAARAWEAVWIEDRGVRLSFLAATEFVNRRDAASERMHVAWLADAARRAPALARARETADVIVVAAHWGRDFADAPTDEIRALADAMLDEGADVVLGAGPHVLHEVTRRRTARGDALVAWSLGNLVSGMGHAYRVGHEVPRSVHPANVQPEARDVVMLRVRACVSAGEVQLARVEAVPFWTLHDESGVRLVALRDASEEVRRERAPVIARAIGESAPLVD